MCVKITLFELCSVIPSEKYISVKIKSLLGIFKHGLYQLTMSLTVEFSCILDENELFCIKKNIYWTGQNLTMGKLQWKSDLKIVICS